MARGLEFEPGTVLVIDRGYQDFAWWLELSRQKVFFVTRLKDNAEYGVVEQRAADRQRGILRDEVVLLTKIQEAGPVARMRRIEVWIGLLTRKKLNCLSPVNDTAHSSLAGETSAFIF